VIITNHQQPQHYGCTSAGQVTVHPLRCKVPRSAHCNVQQRKVLVPGVPLVIMDCLLGLLCCSAACLLLACRSQLLQVESPAAKAAVDACTFITTDLALCVAPRTYKCCQCAPAGVLLCLKGCHAGPTTHCSSSMQG
jgi:hypothetical protein